MINRNEWKSYAPARITTPALIADMDLSHPFQPMVLGARYRAARILVRIHGQPIGYADIVCDPKTEINRDRIISALDQEAIARLNQHLIDDLMARSPQTHISDDGLLDRLDRVAAHHGTCARARPNVTGLAVTVAICTRGRPDTLRHTLESLMQQTYTEFRILVVDNAPGDDSTERLLRAEFQSVDYVCEPKPGLDNARNCAVQHTTTDLLAFIDDDAIADRGWVQALVNAFDTPEVMCITGLVAPARLDTAAQELFERFGYTKGFARLRFNLQAPPPITYFPYRGYHGTGCNSAFRREVFETVGLFDPRLDMGTPVPGGGDLDIFTRIILAGHTLVYDPTLVVFHDHIDDMAVIGRKLGQYQQSFIAYLTKHAFADKGGARALLLDMVRATLRRFFRGLAAVAINRDRPIALVFAQLYYPLLGPFCFYRSHRLLMRNAAKSIGQSPQMPAIGLTDPHFANTNIPAAKQLASKDSNK